MLVGGVVVHHPVQLDRRAGFVGDVGVGALDLLEEREELLVAVPRLERRGHLPGGDLQRREQRRGAVAVVVMGATLDPALACIGRIGTVRSSAWIWDFSSMLSTIAFSGGAR